MENIENVLAPKITKEQINTFKNSLLTKTQELANTYRVSQEVLTSKLDVFNALNFDEICKDKTPAESFEVFNVHLREAQDFFRQIAKSHPVKLQAEIYRDITFIENNRFSEQHERDLKLSTVAVLLEINFLLTEIHAEIKGQRNDSSEHLKKMDSVFEMFTRASQLSNVGSIQMD